MFFFRVSLFCLQVIRTNFESYAKASVVMARAGFTLADSLSQFYSKSPTHFAQAQCFVQVTSHLEAAATKTFREDYGWEILRFLDSWLDSMRRVREQLRVVEQARVVVKNLEQDPSAKRSEIEAANRGYEQHRKALDQTMSDIIQNRFGAVERPFARALEFQVYFSLCPFPLLFLTDLLLFLPHFRSASTRIVRIL